MGLLIRDQGPPSSLGRVQPGRLTFILSPAVRSQPKAHMQALGGCNRSISTPFLCYDGAPTIREGATVGPALSGCNKSGTVAWALGTQNNTSEGLNPTL